MRQTTSPILFKYNYIQSNESHKPVAHNWMSSVQSRFSQWRKIRSLAWCDITFPFHKIAILTNSLESLKYWNVKYAIKLKILVVLLLHQISTHTEEFWERKSIIVINWTDGCVEFLNVYHLTHNVLKHYHGLVSMQTKQWEYSSK